MKKVSVIAAAVVGALASGVVMAEDKVQEGWQVNGYGHLLYNVGQSLDTSETWAHRRDYRAAGAAFSGNPNQVEFTVTKGNNYDNGAWSKYVLKTEYGNNEGGDGRGFYTSSSGNEGHLETGQLEFKEAYVELGDLSFFTEGLSAWVGKRYLNRQAGLITKEYWKQSSGVGTGLQYNKMGVAIVSADAGEGSCELNGINTSCKNDNLDQDGASTTLTSVDFYYNGAEALGGRFDFDVKLQSRVNVDNEETADRGLGLGLTYARDYYGLDGWSLSAITYGKGIASTKGTNFGQWNGGWNQDDRSVFFTSYGVLNISDNFQLGSEIVYWDLKAEDGKTIFGDHQEFVKRALIGLTPSYKINDNLRLEAVLSYANEKISDKSAWSREKDATSFYTATLSPVLTVNNDYFGRPQIKPYVTYMTSSDSGQRWSKGASSESETRVGVEAEIWF